MGYLFTSESVCAGHPDKICDQISDAIVDEALLVDKRSRVAVETLVTTNQIVLAGEVTCKEKLDYVGIARKVVSGLGYTKKTYGFTDKSPISVYIHQQSRDISVGVDDGGAGDQGLMFGYACNQTKELMPLPITLAHRLAQELDNLKVKYSFLRPDGKTQVTVKYEGNKPVGIERVVIAVPHENKYGNEEIKRIVKKEIVDEVLERYGFYINEKLLIVNGTGKWEIGGPASDTGVTGRKIIVDTYGGWAHHGGGCFSGKDATKVDRSGAYAARWVAKNVVAGGLASECEIQVAYVIGLAKPVSVRIETFGTEKKPLRAIRNFIDKLTDFSVGGILEQLDLRKPVYRQTACYGHFGREGVSWEKVMF